MALQMILSDWLACTCVLSLIVAAGAILFRPYQPAPVSAVLLWFGTNNLPQKWGDRWPTYARLWGALPDQHIRMCQSVDRGGFSEWRGSDGAGLRYM